MSPEQEQNLGIEGESNKNEMLDALARAYERADRAGNLDAAVLAGLKRDLMRIDGENGPLAQELEAIDDPFALHAVQELKLELFDDVKNDQEGFERTHPNLARVYRQSKGI